MIKIALRALLFVATLALFPVVTGCGSSGLPSADAVTLPSTEQVMGERERVELTVALAGQALPVVKSEVERLASAGMLTPGGADDARAAVAKVDLVLAKAELWLQGKGEAPGRKEVLDALAAAELAVSLIQVGGGKLPAVTDHALRLARDVIENRRREGTAPTAAGG